MTAGAAVPSPDAPPMFTIGSAATGGMAVEAADVSYHRPAGTHEIDYEPFTDEKDPVDTKSIVERVSKPVETVPAVERVDSKSGKARTPRRDVYINGGLVEADRDITIRAGAIGPAMVDLSLWNLDLQTWRDIGPKDRIEIDLGWEEVGTQRVFDGNVVVKDRRGLGGDREFVLRGRSTNAGQLKSKYSRTFFDRSPHAIVEQIAADIGIKTGYVSRSSFPIEGSWTISKHKPVDEWLDRLTTRAAQQTNRRWTWYTEKGKLSFHPTAERSTDPVALQYGNSVLATTPIGIATDPDVSLPSYELSMRCEPIIERGLTVTVDDHPSIDPDHLHRVRAYVFNSGTTTPAIHTCRATIEPLVTREEVYRR